MSRPFRDLSPAQSYFCDAARFLAALAVAFHHSLDAVDYEPYYQFSRAYHANLGSIGVAVFFLLSGFLIAHTAMRKSATGDYGVGQYFVERTVRIYLVYLPAIVLAVLLAWWMGTLFATPQASPRLLFLNLFMLQGVAPISHHPEAFALLGPSWTLNYEYWFYLLFGLVYLGWQQPKWRWLWLGLAIPVAALLLQLNHVWDLGALWFGGALIAFLFQRVRLNILVGVGIAIAAAALGTALRMTVAVEKPDDMLVTKLVMTVSFAALVLSLGGHSGATTRKDVQDSFTSRIAAYSYSLYITHFLFFTIIDLLWDQQIRWLVREVGYMAGATALLIGANIGAYAFSWVSEQHNETVRRFFLRRLPGTKRQADPAAAAS